MSKGKIVPFQKIGLVILIDDKMDVNECRNMYYNSFLFTSNITKMLSFDNLNYILDVPNFKFNKLNVHFFFKGLPNQIFFNRKLNKEFKKILKTIY